MALESTADSHEHESVVWLDPVIPEARRGENTRADILSHAGMNLPIEANPVAAMEALLARFHEDGKRELKDENIILR